MEIVHFHDRGRVYIETNIYYSVSPMRNRTNHCRLTGLWIMTNIYLLNTRETYGQIISYFFSQFASKLQEQHKQMMAADQTPYRLEIEAYGDANQLAIVVEI